MPSSRRPEARRPGAGGGAGRRRAGRRGRRHYIEIDLLMLGRDDEAAAELAIVVARQPGNANAVKMLEYAKRRRATTSHAPQRP